MPRIATPPEKPLPQIRGSLDPSDSLFMGIEVFWKQSRRSMLVNRNIIKPQSPFTPTSSSSPASAQPSKATQEPALQFAPSFSNTLCFKITHHFSPVTSTCNIFEAMSIRFGRSGNGYDSSQVMETADDDWRQITDLAERRKIQNRLAQRNYRRKLRQRLEELERQAGESPSTSPPASKTPRQKTRQKAKSANTTPARNGAVSGRVTKRPRANSTRTERESSTEEIERSRPATMEPMSATTLSDASPITPGPQYGFQNLTDSSMRNYYRSDFGPLFTTLDVRPLLPTAGEKDNIWTGEGQRQGQPLADTSTHQENTIRMHAQTPRAINGYSPIANYVATEPEFPALPTTYSAHPAVNPNPLHINAPLPRDQFYMTMNYNKLWAAAMRVGKIFNIEDQEFLDDDAQSQFTNKQQPFTVPENTEDLQPTDKQLTIPHHPYIDTIPFAGFRDRMIEYTADSERKQNWEDEERICHSMCENWGVWGETPWESRSWEIGEDFARDWWFLIDCEMLRSTNFWRSQRDLPLLNLKKLRAEAVKKYEVLAAMKRSPVISGKVVEEVID